MQVLNLKEVKVKTENQNNQNVINLKMYQGYFSIPSIYNHNLEDNYGYCDNGTDKWR